MAVLLGTGHPCDTMDNNIVHVAVIVVLDGTLEKGFAGAKNWSLDWQKTFVDGNSVSHPCICGWGYGGKVFGLLGHRDRK